MTGLFLFPFYSKAVDLDVMMVVVQKQWEKYFLYSYAQCSVRVVGATISEGSIYLF